MANVAQRGGSVRVRTGGNTQDYAVFTDDIPDANGKCVGKQAQNTSNPVSTSTVLCSVLLQLSDTNTCCLIQHRLFLPLVKRQCTRERRMVPRYASLSATEK